jgi:hypothetical protein
MQIEEIAYRRAHVLDGIAANHSAQNLLRRLAQVGFLHSRCY